MKYRRGERVKHPLKDEWGVGVVLSSNEESVKVFFVGVGEKTLLLKYVQLTRVSGEEAEHTILDNLSVVRSSTSAKYKSLPASIELFLEKYPGGFHGERFLAEERDYKLKAHTLALETLNHSELQALLEAEDYAEIVRRALKLVNTTNLLFPNEKMTLKDGLVPEGMQRSFSLALFSLLYGTDKLKPRFDPFCRLLESIDAGKWTTATYFLFMNDPEQHMFIKPAVTQEAAELCGFEINYKPRLNWVTYQAVQGFSTYLFTELAELKPRDMIDVQSFMWCIAAK